MSRELSRRGYSMSQLCSIRHDIPVPMHTPGAYGQCWVFHHSGDKQSVVLGTRYGTWWSWYGQFEVGLLQPLQLWLNVGISLVAPVLVSGGRDLCHVQPHPSWFEPTAECRSYSVASNLSGGHLPVGRGSILLVGPLFHFPQYHSGLVSSKNEHVYHQYLRQNIVA